jgi:hypothetical protein
MEFGGDLNMGKRTLHVMLALVLCLSLGSTAAFAGDHGQGRSNHASFHANDQSRDGFGRDRDRDGDHRVFATNSRPAGWSHGRKTGWGNCNQPPGQARRSGCHSNFRTYHRHTDRDNVHARR